MAQQTTMITTIKRNAVPIGIALLLVAVLALTMAVFVSIRNNEAQQAGGPMQHSSDDPVVMLEEHGIEPLGPAQASNDVKTATALQYLLEEEKLAHDVYLKMYDLWGSRVFQNIRGSESMHQSMVLGVMQSRGVADTRTNTVGMFTDKRLQALYDELIARGSTSAKEAYKVGVTVEETDIADLKATLAALDAKDTDIKQVIENLIHSSENHLRAFSRQANR